VGAASAVCAIGVGGHHSPASAVDTRVPVVRVLDGDTFEVRLDGEIEIIRMLGVNTMETGACHASEAKAFLANLIDGGNVTLSADDSDVEIRDRLARWVDVGDLDVGLELIRAGHALAMGHATETERSTLYTDAAAEARSRGVGIWDDDGCAAGPSTGIDVELVVRWDGEGDDRDNVNGEWIDVYNASSTSLPLDGWHVRDTATRFYDFPAGTRVPALSTLRIRVGRGVNTSTTQFWGLDAPIFNNEASESAYLVDPDGDIRASLSSPCRLACSARVDLDLVVNHDAEGDDFSNVNGEYFEVSNPTGDTIELYGLHITSAFYAYYFELGDSVEPGAAVRVSVGTGTDTSDRFYSNRDAPVLPNSGGVASIRTADNLIIDAAAWGRFDSGITEPASTNELRRAVRLG